MLVRRCDVCGCDMDPHKDPFIIQIGKPNSFIHPDTVEACEACVAEIEAYINMMRRTSKEGESDD